MSIFRRFLRRERKVNPKEMIKNFEIGRQMLMNKARETCEELRKKGYRVLEITPLLVSVGKAEKDTPFGIMLLVNDEMFKKFHTYLDMGTYANNQLNLFSVGEYSFLLVTARDDERKVAICYPSAFRKKHVKKIQSGDKVYFYIINGQTNKFTLIYFPNVKWEDKTKEIKGEIKQSRDKPPSTLYR
ncbi:MAG: hypothetical protein NDF53_03265 [archaeon GB-1867-097]|nr:hypothetical protein [Candidatus Culexmicrobium thermophilum]MCS7384734.1 hypothetical protein [Candidatus Culexmicrobium thermophilum]HDO20391.1 hypothetical protein [Candidatus Bathyarchaeota archaeon]